MFIDKQFRNERPAAAGIAILTVSEAEIFLRQRLQGELGKTHPRRDELAAGLTNVEPQSLDGQRVGGRAPAQINVDCAGYRLVLDAIFVPAAVLCCDPQGPFTCGIAD